MAVTVLEADGGTNRCVSAVKVTYSRNDKHMHAIVQYPNESI